MLFDIQDDKNDNIVIDLEDWSTDERLAKEFQTLGFFISDHPLNQFKEIYDQYNIIDYIEFNESKEINEVNVACTVLKVQEKKTQKGNTYAIVKFSDLSSAFELFIFSDVFESNRSRLKEGNSLLITLSKNTIDKENRFKRINVKKISSLNEIINQPINKIKFTITNLDHLSEIKQLSKTNGMTEVNLVLKNNGQNLFFKLKDKRNVDRKFINSLKNKGIYTVIN